MHYQEYIATHTMNVLLDIKCPEGWHYVSCPGEPLCDWLRAHKHRVYCQQPFSASYVVPWRSATPNVF